MPTPLAEALPAWAKPKDRKPWLIAGHEEYAKQEGMVKDLALSGQEFDRFEEEMFVETGMELEPAQKKHLKALHEKWYALSGAYNTAKRFVEEGEAVSDTTRAMVESVSPKHKKEFLGFVEEFAKERGTAAEPFRTRAGVAAQRGVEGLLPNVQATLGMLGTATAPPPDIAHQSKLMMERALDYKAALGARAAGDPTAGPDAGFFEASALSAVEQAPAVLASTAATLGGGPAGGVASAMFWTSQIAPERLVQMREMGIEDNLAVPAAIFSAVPEAIVENLQIRQLVSPALRSGVLAVARQTMMQHVGRMVKSGVTTYSKEMFEEGVQALIGETTKAIAAHLSETAPDVEMRDVLKNVARDVGEAAGSMLFLMGPGHAVGGIRGAVSTRANQKQMAGVKTILQQIPIGARHQALAELGIADGRDRGAMLKAMGLGVETQARKRGELVDPLPTSDVEVGTRRAARAGRFTGDLLSPWGLIEFAEARPHAAETLALIEEPSRRDFEEVIGPDVRMTKEERTQVARSLRDLIADDPAFEQKKQAIAQFDALVDDSLDAMAELKQARDAGDLDEARAMNERLKAIQQQVEARFTAFDTSEVARPVDDEVLRVARPQAEEALPPQAPETPRAAPAPTGEQYDRQRLNAMKKYDLLGIAAERGVENADSMNRKALIASILKAPTQEVPDAQVAARQARAEGAPAGVEGQAAAEIRVRGDEEGRVEAKPREETEVAPPPEPTPAPKKKIGRKGVKKKPAPTAKEAVAKKWEAAEKKAAKEIVGEKWKAAEKKAAKEIVGKKWRAAEAKATEEAESAKPRFYVEESTDGYQVIRRDNNQVEGTYDTEEEAQRVADDTNARYEREAKVIKEKLEPEKPKAKTKSERVVGKGAAGGAMAAIGGDAFAAAEPEPTTLLPEPVEDEQEAPEPPPAVKTLAQKMTQQGMVDGLLEILAPAARSEQALFSSNLKRQALARAAQRDQAAIYKLEQYGKLFRFKSMAEIVEFIDLLETGQKQTDTALQEAADVFRAVLDRTTKRLQEHGVLLQNYEHYFPHLFKRPDAARDVIRKLLGARQLKPATFLKHRKYLTVKEALDAGLELAHHNPVKMIVARLAEEHKYLAGLEIMEGLGVRGMRRFVASNLTKSYQPAGYEIIQDPAFRVVAPPEFTVEEAYDKLLADQLMSIASAMGVSHKRVATMRGQRWGESGPGKSIKTRFAGPISVLAHEIGHQIGNQYGLYEYMLRGPHAEGKVIEKGPHKGKKSKSDAQKKRGAIAKEWRALADLRHEGMEVTEARQDYERMKAEKEAVILEAWLAAPEKMESVAPTITQAWKEFLAAQPVLEPLLHLDRSVVLGRGGITRTLPGVLELGHWAVPKEVATIINSYLKPGLRGHRNKLVAGTYGGVRYISNAMIQASLGLTMFHSLNVTTDAMASSVGLGLQQLGRGQVGKALWNVVRSPFAGIAEVVRGHRLIKAMRMDMREIADPKLKAMVETIIAAGGRAELDAMYHNHAAEGLETSIRTLITGEGSRLLSLAKLPGQTLLAAIEVLAKPTMQWHVPRLKLGVFYRFAQDVYSEANRRGWDDDRIQTELARAWDSVDNRMGQLVYDNLGWARWLRDTSMAAVRSVGWNLGSWREYGGALADVPLTVSRVKGGGDLVSRRIGYAVGALTTYAMLGAIFAYLWRGRWPWDEDDYEEKDLFFPKTGKTNPDGTPERLSFPTYAKDIVAYTTRPGKTIEHKLNPIWNLIADLWENENYYGTEIRNRDDPIVQQIEDVALRIGESFIPFSVRNWMRMTAAGDDPWVSAATALSGIGSAPRYITETPAQALMSKITQAKIAQGARTQEAAEWSQKRKRLVREVRSGKKADLSGLTSLQIRDIRREAKMTSFQARFDNLSFYDALDVFNVCTAEERTAVFPQLVRKKGTAKKVTDDMLEMYYALRVGQGQVDVRRKADLAQAGKTLMSISTGQRSGEADDVYELRLQEAIASLKANPEFELDRRAVSALMRASVTPKKGKKRRFKTTRMYYGTGKKRGRYTAFGKRVARVWQALGI